MSLYCYFTDGKLRHRAPLRPGSPRLFTSEIASEISASSQPFRAQLVFKTVGHFPSYAKATT